ncbi:MAG TPA: CHASE2 domain-containing protein [Candidatus Binatia bacterium]|nr:CHASE2 domain-containing protein [Candidatus Binatia bacterium]
MAPVRTPVWRARQIALGAALVAWGVFLLEPAPLTGLRHLAFDAAQWLLPRERHSQPAMVVEIDQASLERFGQWPWPRERIAELAQRIADAGAAAIGLDLLFPEADRMSPHSLANRAWIAPDLAEQLRLLPDADQLLADTLRGLPVVIGVAAQADAAGARPPPRAPPLRLHGEAAGLERVLSYGQAVRSLPLLEAAARGLAVLNGEPEGGIVRRLPLLLRVQGVVLPTLSLELLRIGTGAPSLDVDAGPEGLRGAGFRGLRAPVAADGRAWLRFGHMEASRYVSAADVLAGRPLAERLGHKIVLVALTGVGMVDFQSTPLGRVPGVEIHVQAAENLFDGSVLRRPAWARNAEGAALLGSGVLLAMVVPSVSPLGAFLLLAALLGGGLAAALAAFGLGGVLLDPVPVLLGAVPAFAAALGGTLSSAQHQRRELTLRLQDEREAAARMGGELEAARRVQMGMLPAAPGELAGDARVDIAARMEPARIVGGDLYDFFRLPGDRICCAVGDVSGKGLPAAMFMALAKALLRGAVLRADGDLPAALAACQRELARENPEALFVTLSVWVLDLGSGLLRWCNAGHEPAYLLGGAVAECLRLPADPPLCVLDDVPFTGASRSLQPGQVLLLLSDGVTEAAGAGGEL